MIDWAQVQAWLTQSFFPGERKGFSPCGGWLLWKSRNHYLSARQHVRRLITTCVSTAQIPKGLDLKASVTSLGGGRRFLFCRNERRWPPREGLWFPHRRSERQSLSRYQDTKCLVFTHCLQPHWSQRHLLPVLPPALPSWSLLPFQPPPGHWPPSSQTELLKTQIQPQYFPTENPGFYGFLLLLELNPIPCHGLQGPAWSGLCPLSILQLLSSTSPLAYCAPAMLATRLLTSWGLRTCPTSSSSWLLLHPQASTSMPLPHRSHPDPLTFCIILYFPVWHLS